MSVIIIIIPRAPASFETNYIKTNLDILLNESTVQVNFKISTSLLGNFMLAESHWGLYSQAPKGVHFLFSTIWNTFH